jgi:hypothetical protein
MKYLICLLIPIASFASERDCELQDGVCRVEVEKLQESQVSESTPQIYRDSTIQRTLPDGTKMHFDGNNYKIVPRSQSKFVKKTEVVIIRPPSNVKRHKHNITLLIGDGPAADMNRVVTGPTTAVVTHENETLFGAQYSYDFLELNDSVDLNLTGQVQTNETFLIGIGASF